MASNNTPQWEAPKFSFNTQDQVAEWKQFYIRVIDYLEALDIDPDQEDETKRGRQQIKMIFQGEGRQALQTLLDNNTITAEDQPTPTCALNTIQTTIKEDEHFWHLMDELFSDVGQQPNKDMYTLNNRITTLVNNCKFTNTSTKETIKIIENKISSLDIPIMTEKF